MQETQCDSWVRKIGWRRDRLPTPVFLGFPRGSYGKESTCNAGELGQILGLGRSPGEENGYPLQYFDLENSMDRGAWQAIAQGVTNFNILIYNTHSTFPFGKPLICFLCLRVYFCLINVFICIFFFFLDSTYKQYHMIFIFLCLAYFTQYNNLQAHLCCCNCHYFIPFMAKKYFLHTHTHTHTHTPRLLYPFIY